jgi:hypothetical protein
MNLLPLRYFLDVDLWCVLSRMASATLNNALEVKVQVSTYNHNDNSRFMPFKTYVLAPGEKTTVVAGPGTKLQLQVATYVWTVDSGSTSDIPKVRQIPYILVMYAWYSQRRPLNASFVHKPEYVQIPPGKFGRAIHRNVYACVLCKFSFNNFDSYQWLLMHWWRPLPGLDI